MGDFTRNFSRHEFACKCGCGYDTADFELIIVLQLIADYFDAAVSISSGSRCYMHNTKVGGGKTSQHLYGRAADITVFGVHPDEVANYLERVYEGKYGIGRYNSFTHIDTRSWKARWDERD